MALTDNQTLAAAADAKDQDELDIDLIELMYTLLEKAKWLLLAALVGAVIAGVYVTQFVTPVYTATAKLYVLNTNSSVVNVSDLQIGSNLAKDYVEVFSNWHVHKTVRDRLGLNYTYGQMGEKVSCSNPSNTRLLYIKTKSTDPQEAKALADTYAEVACEFIAATMGMDAPNVFEEARVPTTPTSPHVTRTILLGAILAALAAAVFFVIRFIVDDRIRTAEMIEKHLNLPVLGMMPEQNAAKNEKPAVKDKKPIKKSKGGASR